MIDGICLGDILVDCKNAEELSAFYANLLGWKKSRIFDLPAVSSENGVIFLFDGEDDYVPPVWPEEDGKQQKQVHFDFQVPDVPAAVQKAETLGAVRAPQQFGGDYWTTMLDPAGHPFCLCKKD